MTVKEIIEMLSHYDGDSKVQLAWYSYGNYNITDDFELTVYSDTYEDAEWNIISTGDVVIDLWDF